MKPLVYRKSRRVRTEPVPERIKLHITKGDAVQVISGDDAGKRGTVLRVFPKTGRVVVDGVNLAKRHRKTDAPTRFRRRKDADGTIERIAVKSGDAIPRSR